MKVFASAVFLLCFIFSLGGSDKALAGSGLSRPISRIPSLQHSQNLPVCRQCLSLPRLECLSSYFEKIQNRETLYSNLKRAPRWIGSTPVSEISGLMIHRRDEKILDPKLIDVLSRLRDRNGVIVRELETGMEELKSVEGNSSEQKAYIRCLLALHSLTENTLRQVACINLLHTQSPSHSPFLNPEEFVAGLETLGIGCPDFMELYTAHLNEYRILCRQDRIQ